MGGLAWRGVFLVLPLVAAGLLGHAGCAADPEASTTSDAGPETVAPPVPDADLPDTSPPAVGCEGDRASDGMWQHLRCAGLYADIATKRVAPELRPYKPALELWVDGATKERFIFLPPGTKIDTTNIDEWVFPNGTKLWKEFRLEGKRIETRLYEKGADEMWRHASFVWSDDESDAVRVDGGRRIARGGPDVPPYEIPTATQCNDCHGGRKDRILGFEAVNLGLTGASGITLATLVTEGLLTSPPPAATLAFPEDATGKAAPALAWMHVSCGPCHNQSGGGSAKNSRVYTLTHASELFAEDGGAATVAALDAFTRTVGHSSTIEIPDGGGATFQFIKAGDPSSSLVSYLSGRRVAASANPSVQEQMPPFVTRLVDTKGHALLDDWISALPP